MKKSALAPSVVLCMVVAIFGPITVRTRADSHSTTSAAPATRAVSPAARPMHWTRPIEQKCFYLLSILKDDPKAKACVLANSDLQHLAKSKHQTLTDACSTDAAKAQQITAAARWGEEEIKTVNKSLHQALFDNPAVGAEVARQLRESGMFIRQQPLSDADLITYAWEQAARGINHMLDVYGDGKSPQYPRIDSISFKPDSEEWAGKTREAAKEILAATSADHDPFFAASMQLALKLMNLNDRDEAGRFEPMSEGENKPALDRVPTIEWKKYTDCCILVPGIGPEDPKVALSQGGRANCELAAAAFQAGKAPFILVSGGYVHPNKTRFSEAVEMRRELIEKLRIPADAVLIDPHARHTTTNLRNAARIAYRYGLPMDLPALVVSNANQIHTIASAGFAKRCQHELGYEPARIGRELSDTSLEIRFNLDSLEADPLSPLDP